MDGYESMYYRRPCFFQPIFPLARVGVMVAMLKPYSLRFFFLACLILCSIFIAVCALDSRKDSNPDLKIEVQTVTEVLSRIKNWAWRSRSNRRLMIGSTAPTCSFNECRGCRFSCSAEQVPVDANDPINSAYHYRCICHRS
ncbi:stomagen [Wolffia australiana]